jgi:O-antigen/teichoic acid export membrane protein
VQLGLDGGLRIALALGFGVLGVDSATWYCAILIIAPVLAALVTLPRIDAPGAGSGVSWGNLARGLGILTVAALLSQIVVNIGVINVKLLDPGDAQLGIALLSALTLVRIPLFVFASLQASLLPGLAAALARGDRAGYQRMLLRTLGVVSALGVIGGLVMVSIGPWLIQVLFDAPGLLTRADFGWLAAGTLAYLWAVVLGQGVLAQGNHRDQSLAWLAGVIALIGVTMLPGSVAQRVEYGYAAGSLVVALGMAVALWLASRREPAAIERAAAAELAEFSPVTTPSP